MKKIGMIGGMAWPSTMTYYRLLCSKTNDYFCRPENRINDGLPLPTPHLFIESLNIRETRSLRGKPDNESSWGAYDDFLTTALLRLEKAGAEINFIASNTPHSRLPAIEQHLSVPIISIVDSAVDVVVKTAAKRVLTLGTSVTMRSNFYADALNRQSIEATTPIPDAVIEEIDQLIDVDIGNGEFEKARDRIDQISKCFVDPVNDVVCLACTELPLAFPDQVDDAIIEFRGVRYVNTMVVHVETVLSKAL